MNHPASRTALRYVLTSLLAGALVLGAVPALSQGPGGPGGHGPGYGPPGRMMTDEDRSARWEQMRARWEERHAERMELLESRLKLTDAQKPAWEALQAAQRAHHDGRFAKQQALKTAATAPDYFTQKIALEESQLASLRKVSEAVLALYAVLTPEQQKILDDAMAKRLRYARRGRK